MPTGKFIITDIPTQADVDALKEEYMLEASPPEIKVEGTGPFTMIAEYPGAGETKKSFDSQG